MEKANFSVKKKKGKLKVECMSKELIISIIIVILIFIGNHLTEKYTQICVSETNQNLSELREEISKDEVDLQSAKNKADETYNKWNGWHQKLAFYIEHNELEKINTQLTGVKSYIEQEEYAEAIPELDKGMYILQHIKDKNAVNLKNIF